MTPSTRLAKLIQTFTILDWHNRLVPLRFNVPQQMAWAKFADKLDHRERLWAIILKARREGMSTLIQGTNFGYGFLAGNGETITLAHEGKSSRSIFEMQRRMYMNFPIAKPSDPPRNEIRIPTPWGSVVHWVTTAGAEASGRGTNPIALHLSEVAFWPYPETMTAIINAMPPPHVQSLVFIESTANGKSGRGELFYEMWQDASQGRSNYVTIFLPWFALPDYRMTGVEMDGGLDDDEKEQRKLYGVDDAQLAWYRFILYDQCHGDPMLRRQEYPGSAEEAFIASGMPAFDPRALARQSVNIRPPDRRCTVLGDGKLVDRGDGELKLWKYPDGTWPGRGHRYVCAVDSAVGGVFGTEDRGDTRSWTGVHILDADTGLQVGEWYGPMVGRLFAPTCAVLVQRLFPDALLSIELNSESGRILQADMREIYNHTHLHPWKGKRDKVKPGAPHVYGWETNSYTRGMMLDNAQYLLATDAVTIRSQVLLSQFSDLTKSDTGRYEAEVGRDDLAIAALIAWESWQENFRGKTWTMGMREGNEEERLRQMGLRIIPDANRALEEHIKKIMGRSWVATE